MCILYIVVTRIGVVMCRTTITNEWYPESFYSHKNSLCAFEQSFPVLTLQQYTKNIHDALSKFSTNIIFV